MIIRSRAGLVVELPDAEFMGGEKTLTVAGRVYKARKWLAALAVRDSLIRLNENVNRVRNSLGLSEIGMSIASDPCRQLDDVSMGDIEWMTEIASWCPNWTISAPATWGVVRRKS